MTHAQIKEVRETLKSNQVSEIAPRYIVRAKSEIVVKDSKKSAEVFKANWKDPIDVYESFYLMLLNRSNKIIGVIKVGQGGIAGCTVDETLICAYTLMTLAKAAIIAHNHPSGNTKPSESDVHLTHAINKALDNIGVQLLDHVILTPFDEHFSFADEGIL